MIKVLVANENAEQNFRCCEYLSNDKTMKIESTYDGENTLKKYLQIEPNIFVLDSCFHDMNYVEIINKLSNRLEEAHNCNTILTIPNISDELYFCNFSKIFKILRKPLNYLELSNTLNLMKLNISTASLTEFEVKELLLKLNFNIHSNGTKYLVSAILECYYYPSSLECLDKLFESIAYTYNITPDNVRSCIRNALTPINMSRNFINNPLLNLFDSSRNITPKYFLDIICTYFHIKKNKK